MAARAADAKLGRDTVVLAMGDFLGVTDAFVITRGANARQVRDHRRRGRATGEGGVGAVAPRHRGPARPPWVLMDYGDFLVHVFQDEARAVLRPRAAVGRRASSLGGRGFHRAAPALSHSPGRLEVAQRPAQGPARRTAPWWPPAPGRRWPRAPPPAGPSSSKVTPVTPGGPTAVKTIWATAWIWVGPTVGRRSPQVHRGRARGDVGAEDRGLGRDGALQPGRRLRCRWAPSARAPQHGGQDRAVRPKRRGSPPPDDRTGR